MPGQPQRPRSPWTGQPLPGRDNRSKQAPAPVMAQQPPPIQGAKPPAEAMRPVQLPPALPPTAPKPKPVSTGLGYTPGVTGRPTPVSQRGDTAPAPSVEVLSDRSAPLEPQATGANPWEQAAAGVFGEMAPTSQETWDQQRAAAANAIDQQTAQDRWQLAEQMGARGFGASGQFEQSFADIGTAAGMKKAEALAKIDQQQNAERLDMWKAQLEAAYQFASETDKHEIDQLLAQIEQGRLDLNWSEFIVGATQTSDGTGVRMPTASEVEAWKGEQVYGKALSDAWAKQGLSAPTAMWQDQQGGYRRQDQAGVIYLFNWQTGVWEPQ